MTGKLRHPALTQLETERDDVYAFEIDGQLSKEEVEEVYQVLEKAYAEHDKIDLLIRIGRYDGFDINTLFSDVAYAGKLHPAMTAVGCRQGSCRCRASSLVNTHFYSRLEHICIRVRLYRAYHHLYIYKGCLVSYYHISQCP